jgi:glutamyl-tRNA reductase
VALPGKPYRSFVLPDPSFHVVGVSHHTASLDERERFALSPADTTAFLAHQHSLGKPSLLLSTCNRCELYWSGDDDLEPWFTQLPQAGAGRSDLPTTRYDGEAAVRHLFSVVAGLDSQILGETEVLGQVRRAYDMARAAGTTTREMDLILSAALSAGRRVRAETMLGRHPASVSSAAVELIIERGGGLGPGEVLVLGAGEAAEGVLRALQDRGATGVTLLSRHPARTRVLAEAWGARVGDWGELDDRLETARVLFVATAAPRPVVSVSQLSRGTAETNGRQLWVVDLAVPRNVEPSARALAGLQLFDLDDLQRLCCPAAGAPSVALAEAERVIEEELLRLGMHLRGHSVAPKLAELHRCGVEIAEQESAWALAQLDGLSESDREIVRQMADRLVRRVLYPVSRNLRSE